MTDFAKLFDDEKAKRQDEEAAATAHAKAKADEAEVRRQLLAEPLDDILKPLLDTLKSQLDTRGIKVDDSTRLTVTARGDFPVVRAFRLEMADPTAGYGRSAVYGFRVYTAGTIEGLMFDDGARSSNVNKRIFHCKPNEFTEDHVRSVFGEAIKDLVGR